MDELQRARERAVTAIGRDEPLAAEEAFEAIAARLIADLDRSLEDGRAQ
jgi:hypothetical protein